MRKENTINYKKRAKKLLIAAGILAAVLVLLLFLRLNARISEWMASNVSRMWIVVSSKITSIFPFSLYELLLYVAIIAVIALVVMAIVFFSKKNAVRAVSYLLVILVVGLGFGNVYTLSAGFSYYRTELDVPYYQSEYLTAADKQTLFELADFMIDDFNAVARSVKRDEQGRTKSPYSNKELSDKLIVEYERLKSDYFSDFTPSVKTILSKNIMSHMHITGVFFAPFGEANVNPLTPDSDMPVTMAHELAHAKGVMRESDANLVAYYITITSDDEYLRYSGYKACYDYLLSIVSDFDIQKADELYQKIDQSVKNEWILNGKFWGKYTLLEDITDWFNDLYLKMQGQKEGTGSYTDPIIPPGEVIVPGGGEQEGGEETITVYSLNSTQRMILKAIEDRKNK